MSEGAAEGGAADAAGGDAGASAPLSDGQFGGVPDNCGDVTQTAQSPGIGIFSQAYAPWATTPHPQHSRRRKRRKHKR